MGYVYILTNKSYRYGWLRRKLLKIGQTSKNPEDRAKELSSTGVPTPFEVAYYLQSDRYEEIEKEMHRRLGVFRSNENREFFRYPINKAIKLLDKLDKEYSPVKLSSIKTEPESIRLGSESNRFVVEPTVISNNYTPQLGVNGDHYWSAENGFQSAVNANGIAAAIPNHVRIIIDNDELELRASREHLERRIDELQDDIDNLEAERREVEATVVSNQEKIAEKEHLLSGLKAIDNLATTIDEKIVERSQQQVKKAELESELKKYPEAEGTPKRRQLRLYRVYGIVSFILFLALYFFYISALDKSFFSSIDTNSENVKITGLNELFDPTAVFKTFREFNFWLVFASFFPLALALAIHPCIGYMTKGFEKGQKLRGFLFVLGIIAIVAITFVLDSLIALKVSEQIHNATRLISREEIEAWKVIPRNPFTWDLNIYIVLFFGFVVSLFLGLFFHFTVDGWTEARVRITDDRDTIEKELRGLEVEMKNLDEDIERHSDDSEKAKQGIEAIPDDVLIKAEIEGLDADIQHLTENVESGKKRIVSIQSEIAQKQNFKSDLESRIGKILIDLVTLRRHVATFMDGWTTFLAAKNDGADSAIEKAQEIAEETLNKYIQSGEIRWESK